ncbi:MAG: hypothetical protein ACP5IA_07535 [Sediminispirochaetaceae bacterium]
MKIPPFCPNRECSLHHSAPPHSDWYVRDGHYRSAAHGRVQRFRCKRCGCRFSSQTFSIDYAVKRDLSYHRLFSLLISCSGIRDMGRILGVSPNCITNRISRLARQSLAVHAELLSHLSLREDLVADGFESFAVSQYFPNNIQLLAGKDSQYWLFSGYAHLRRKGRMTDYQRRRNEKLREQFTLGGVTVYDSFTDLIRLALITAERSPHRRRVQLFTDEHRSYRQVLKSLSDGERSRLSQRRCSSTLPRTVSNQLFAVNYLDRQIRKDMAEHTRETVQFARNVVNQMERLAIYRTYHNYFKPYRIGAGEEGMPTHAEKAGLPARAIRIEKKSFFTQRRFLSRVKALMIGERKVWLRMIKTPLRRYAEDLPTYVWA